MKRYLTLTLISLLILSCSSRKPKSEQKNPPEKSPVTVEKIWATDSVFLWSESALYDSERDVIYVSNINENPRKKDGNGFISNVSSDGSAIEVAWVTGLSSPKGMGLKEDMLYVTDVDEVVVIDVVEAKIVRKVPLENAGMLNDIAIGAAGMVWMTDMDSGRVCYLKDEMINIWLDGLPSPNGILIDGDKVLIASSSEGTLTSYDKSTKKGTLLGEGMSKADGIIKLAAGEYLVSDWFGELFIVSDAARSLLKTKDSGLQSADVGLIEDKNILLVPTFFSNSLIAYQIK